jgi:hypothetical protein
MEANNLPNLYDFLRQLKRQADRGIPGAAPLGNGDKYFLTITEQEKGWLESFLKPADMELHFKGRRVGGTDDNPVVAQDYLIVGDQVDIFSLLTQAMMQNPTLAELVQAAAKFFQDHVPSCEHCKAAVLQYTVHPSWEFKPHPVPKEEREFPCPQCDTGELMAVGFTHPNGQADYECNICGHTTSFP